MRAGSSPPATVDSAQKKGILMEATSHTLLQTLKLQNEMDESTKKDQSMLELVAGHPYLVVGLAGAEISELCESSFWSEQKKQSVSNHN